MPINGPSRSILQKCQRAVILRSPERNILKLLPDTTFDTTFQNDVLVSLQLFPFVCSIARNFHNG